jgi:hypothetical protein
MVWRATAELASPMKGIRRCSSFGETDYLTEGKAW